MSTILTENPYQAPEFHDDSILDDVTNQEPTFLVLLGITVCSVAAGIVTFFILVWALILGGALAGEPYFTMGVCLATFLPLVVAFCAELRFRRLLITGYRKLFPMS